jgi:hypothetical protein
MNTSEEPGIIPPATTFFDDDEPEEVIQPEEVTRCVCNSNFDTGAISICCDKCSVWQHMNCMRLTWTAEEAEKLTYLCEKCAPAQHKEVLTMLKKGTWKPLPFKSVKDKTDELEDEARIGDNDEVHHKPKKRLTRASSGMTSPEKIGETVRVRKLQQELQVGMAKGDEDGKGHATIGRNMTDPFFGGKKTLAPQRRGAFSLSSEDNGDDVANTGAVHNSSAAGNSSLSPAVAMVEVATRNGMPNIPWPARSRPSLIPHPLPGSPLWPFTIAGGYTGRLPPPDTLPYVPQGTLPINNQLQNSQLHPSPYPASSSAVGSNAASGGHEDEKEAPKTPTSPAADPALK